MSKTLMQQGYCRFFRGIQHDKCEAGMPMASVRFDVPADLRSRTKFGRTWACSDEGARLGVPCEKREFPTAAEVAESQAEVMRAMDAYVAGRSPCCNAPLTTRAMERTTLSWCSKCEQFVGRSCKR